MELFGNFCKNVKNHPYLITFLELEVKLSKLPSPQMQTFTQAQCCPLHMCQGSTTTITTSTASTTTEAPIISEETVVLITGGYGPDISGTEIYPPVSGCSPPDLPSGSQFHSTFLTTGQNQVVTCGGGFSASCLVLDLKNEVWDGNMMDHLTQPRQWHAAVSMENIGTYLIGGFASRMKRTTDFLPEGSTEWMAGPDIPVDMIEPCAIQISSQNFLIIHNTDIREYQVDISDPTSNRGWRSATKWPQLQTSRTQNPGCSKIDDYVVIAGGFGLTGWLRSTELLNLSTKTIGYGGDLNSPRGRFQMATITRNGQQLLLALGGWDGSYLDSVEQFSPISNTWSLAPTGMEEARAAPGAVAVPRDMVCRT